MFSSDFVNVISSIQFRFILIGIILFILLVVNSIRIIRFKRKANKVMKIVNIILSSIITIVLITFLLTADINWISYIPTFETRVFIVFVLFILLLILNGVRFLKNTKANKLMKAFNISSFIFMLIAILLTVFIRPHIIETSPEINTVLVKADTKIEMEFDIPVDYKNIEFNISPEIDGVWEWEDILEGTILKRKAVFVPSESFYPGSPIVVYVTGIKAIWWQPKAHEYALELKSPEIPEFVSSSPKDLEKNIAIETDLVLRFDNPIGEFVDIKAEFTPALEYDSVDYANKKVLTFKEPLKQDQTYSAVIYRTERSYDVKSDEDIIRGDTQEISSFSFAIVATPLIESYFPKGDIAPIEEEIKIVFDQNMNRDSVEDNLIISPEFEYTFEWEGNSTLYIVPKENLTKATKYDFIISKDAYSEFGGKIGEDIKFGFTTIGYVTVKSSSPVSGATGLEPSTTNVVIEFNQEVDKQSAQNMLSFTPKVSGTFKWEGNTMTYVVAGKLDYSTKYTTNLAKGVKSIKGLDSKDSFSLSFTTRDNIFSLNIPWYAQQEGFTCNIAATRMALAYYGIYRSEYDIKSGVGIGSNPNADWVAGYGVHASPVASYINSQGRSATVKIGWNVADMMYEVQAGNPVIIWEYNRYSTPAGAYTLSGGYTAYKGMHSEVIRGYIENPNNPYYILTNDPWRGKLTYSRATFDSAWSYLGNTAIVVK